MDINNSLNVLVDSLSKQILEQVQSKVESSLTRAIQEQLKNIDVQSRVDNAAANAAKAAVERYKPNTEAIDSQISAVAQVVIANLEKTAKSSVASAVQDRILNIDFDKLASASITQHLDSKIKHYSFPEASIPVASVKFDKKISGDNIAGGIIEQFGSTGIDDKATDCRLTILDDHTVFENTLLATGLHIKGPTTLEGDLIIKGTIPEDSPAFISIVKASKERLQAEIDSALFVQYRDLIFEKIRADGLDLNKIKLNGVDVITDKALMPAILESNLQKLGVLRELQVKGESLFNNSIYITDKRLGINTLEPGAVLSVWDEEVEIQISKRKKDTAQIGSIRNHAVVLSSNNKENLVLNTDGSVTAQSITIGAMNFSSAASAPNYEASKGTVVFNENPSIGGPLGWVSLGGARWANFGIID